MFRTLLSLTALAGAVAWASAEYQTPAKEKGLHGYFEITHGEKDGKELPAQDFQGSVVRFEDNKILGHDKNKKEFFSCTYTLDKSTTPWKIHMTGEIPKPGLKTHGVLEIKNDSTIHLAYSLPGGATPTSFKTQDKQQAFTLKRLIKKDVKNPGQ